MTDKRKWTHKVLKRQRGGDGKWFRYPAAATFPSLEAARKYASEFAAEQRGVAGTCIDVETRAGRCVSTIDTTTGKATDWQ